MIRYSNLDEEHYWSVDSDADESIHIFWLRFSIDASNGG